MEIKGKYVIAYDTICDGMQCETEGKENKDLPVLYDSPADANWEIFCDAMSGLNGTDDDYFKETGLDKKKVLSEMKKLKEDGDSNKMRDYLQTTEGANYYDEHCESAETFVLGRKTIWTGKGITILGTKLEDI